MVPRIPTKASTWYGGMSFRAYILPTCMIYIQFMLPVEAVYLVQ